MQNKNWITQLLKFFFQDVWNSTYDFDNKMMNQLTNLKLYLLVYHSISSNLYTAEQKKQFYKLKYD